ncbi:MAG: T9SS type A sorting domain-containing protein [Crocinitomicaceae bacterium]
MKKILFLTTLLISQLTFSQVIDVFNYTGALNANGWTTHSGTAGQLITSTTSLTYPGLATSTGNKAVMPNGSEDANIAISGITGTGYSSFIMSLPNTTNTSTAAGGAYFYGFGATSGAVVTSFHGKIWIKQGVAANTFKLGLTYTGSTATFTTAEYNVNTPIFVVLSVDTAAQTANLYVNPTPGAAAPVATLTDNTGTTSPNFASIFLRQAAGTGNIEIDEIRAGSTYASVTPAGVASCNITSAGLTNLTCNDAGTTSIPADDYLTFDLNPTGTVLGTTYTVSVPSGTITPTSGTYGAATSFQLQGGSAGAGNVIVSIIDNSTMGCSLDETITDPGACSSAIPLITLAPSSLTGFDHIVGTPSAEQTFTAAGLSLSGDITVTAPTNFEISLTSGAGFTNSIVLSQTLGTVPTTTIYARANAAAYGMLADAIIATSMGADNDSVLVSGFANDYVYYMIDEISTVDTNGVADSMNVLVELTGVVYCIDFDGNTGYSITLIDGSNSGINLYSPSDVSSYTAPTEGDSIRLFGKIGQYNGLLEVIVDSIEVLAQGSAIMSPTVVITLDESTESQYIKMMNLTLVTPMATFATGSSNIDVTDGVNTFVMRIDSDTDIPGSAAPQGAFNVTGVGGQFDSSLPYDSGYQIFPCSLSSIEDVCTTPSTATNTIDSATAEAVATGFDYQWIDCSTNSFVSGATNQSFTAITSGSYAVIITNGACFDTSDCVTLAGTNVGLNESTLANLLSVYPNPVINQLTLNNSSNSIVSFDVIDAQGKLISTGNSVEKSTSISTSSWEQGVYFIRCTSNAGDTVIKIIK